MLRFFASDWNRIIRELESLSNVFSDAETFTALLEGRKNKIIEPLERIAESCARIGLKLSASYAMEMMAMVRSTPSMAERITNLGTKHLDPLKFQSEASVLRKRIDDELGAREFFALESRYSQYFDNPNPFGEAVGAGFPSATINIEEAGKCLALDRATACVYHLMRVMEAGLRATAKNLGIPYAPSWESYLRQIDDCVTMKHKKKGIRWKRDEAFFTNVSAHLHSVKVAWRNPTMHIVRDYTPGQAGEVFLAVQAFMRHLAARLHE